MRRFLKTELVALVALFLVVAMMPQAGQAAAYWKKKYERFSATAAETLATGDVVCLADSDSKAYKADANDSNKRPGIGIICKGGAANSTVEIVPRGILAGQTAASPGVRLFLSETPGTITITGPTNAQTLGFVLPGTAASSTTYFISVVIPASAGAGY